MLKAKINLIVFLVLFSSPAFCQTTYIFKDDSLLRNKFIGEFENSLNQPYNTVSPIDFKEKLPDGEYIYVWLHRKDSAKKDLKDYVYIKGQYKDSLRQGRFEYYTRYKEKGKWVNKLMKFYTYRDGLLDGYYISNLSISRYEEGYYKEGKRHGFFISYDFSGKGEIKEIELYEENVLKYKVVYKNGEMQQLNTNPCQPPENFKMSNNKGETTPLRVISPCND